MDTLGDIHCHTYKAKTSFLSLYGDSNYKAMLPANNFVMHNEDVANRKENELWL